MKAPLTFFVCCLILFAGTGLASSQPIEVSIADTLSAAPGASVTIPILVGDLTGRDVLFYQTSIFFDESVLKATGASSVGTLSEPFGEPTVDISVEGQILVGGSDTTPLSGSGILVKLNFEVVGQPGDSTVLDFVGFIFNTGDPPAATTNGGFVVVPPDLPDIAVVPTSHDFGEVLVDASAVQDFVIHNQGTAALLVKAVNLSGVNAELFNIKIENPPFTLAPGDSQNFMVSFQPTSEGPKSATLEILSNDPDQDTVRVELSGTGLPAPVPNIAVTPTSHDFGTVSVDSSAAQTFVVADVGTANLVVSATNLVGANPEQFSLDSLRVPFTLTPGDSQSLVVNFQPTSEGPKSATLEILSNDPDQDTVRVELSGTGLPAPVPNIAVTPTSHDFGAVSVDSSAAHTFVVADVGTADLVVSATNLVGANPEQFSLDSLRVPFTLAPGDSQNFVVTFQPTSEGPKSATLEILSNDPDQDTVRVDLSGTGLPAPVPNIAVTPTSHDFGAVIVDSSAEQSFVVANLGTANLVVSATKLVGANPEQFSLDSGGVPFTLAPGDSQSLVVTFQPTSEGPQNATLEILSNDPDQDTVRVDLSGTGLPAPVPNITVSPTSHDFGAVIVDSSVAQSFVVANLGTADLVVSATNLVGANPEQFSLDSLRVPFTLTPGDSQNLVVTFQPTSEGPKSATLEILSNDADQDTVRVELQGTGIALLTLELAIKTPQDGQVACDDSVLVEGRVSVSGGLPPLAMACEVNGISANVSDSSFSVTVPVGFGETLLVASCTVIDSLGTKVSSRDSIRITRTLPPSCLVEIISPRDSATVNSDSIEVTAVTTVADGTPPFTMHCTINGATAALADTSFSATVPLVIGENEIVATCTVVDSCGNQTVCSDTITVFRPQVEISCQVEIVAPLDNSFVCADSITVAGKLEISNAASPLKIACEVNGRPAVVTDTSFVAVVPVSSGDNLLLAICTIVDSLGRKATCSDSVSVFRDDITPTCTFSDEGSFVTGTFFDLESGIFEIKAVKLKNATLSVEPFAVGADSVNFRLDAIDPNQPKGFSIDVVDVCGNEFNCDPILFTLTTDRSSRQFEFSFYSTERYFRLTNHGLTEIRVDLNGNKFTLLTTPNLAKQKLNAFVMPTEGTITIDMQPYLQESENSLLVAYHGAAGTSADLMLVDDVQEVDYVLDLEEVPAEFQLEQNYPNPFNPSTTIDYQLPEASRVSLKIYNLRGQEIRKLFDGRQQAGVHSLVWDGKNDHGETVASGIYVVRLVAGDATAGQGPDFVQSRKMALVK